MRLLLKFAAAATMFLGLTSLAQARTARTTSTLNISIVDFAFSPVHDTIVVHSTVHWTNTSSTFSHGAVNTGASAETFNTGVIGPGGSGSHTFDNLGIFPYQCVVHGASMPGTIVVVSSTPVQPPTWGKLKRSYRGAQAKARTSPRASVTARSTASTSRPDGLPSVNSSSVP
jgi:plastocyanin